MSAISVLRRCKSHLQSKLSSLSPLDVLSADKIQSLLTDIEIILQGSETLIFGDLVHGDHFVAFPTPGDNSGHGGYKTGAYVFRKITDNAAVKHSWRPKHLHESDHSDFPASMPVLKVLL